jgi:hypothetical protein
MNKRFAVLIHILILTAVFASAPFYLKGVQGATAEAFITSDRIWALADSPVTANGNVTVATGATLTIEPGVEVQFQRGCSLIINGSLTAVGTSSQRITFASTETNQVPGFWNGIIFESDKNASFVLSSCVVKYARNGVTMNSSGKALIEKSEISYNSISGISVVKEADLVIKENVISHNSNGVSTAGGIVSGIEVVGNSVSQNENGIYIYASGRNSRINNVSVSSNDLTSNLYGVRFYSYGGFDTAPNAFISNVSVSGNRVQFNKYGIYLSAQSWGGGGEGLGGAYIINSLISRNIVSSSDIAVYVDSISNWYGWISGVSISENRIYSSGYGVLMHAFHYPAPPFTNDPFDVVFQGNAISADTKGVSIEGDVKASFSGNSISDNLYGVFLFFRVAIVFDSPEYVVENNDFYRNSLYGLYADNVTVVASNNFWGASSGPFHEVLNPSGQGDRVSGDASRLVLLPFLDAAVGHLNAPPSAVLEADKTSVDVNQTVNFDGTSSSDDSGVERYFFDFGDGQTYETSLGVVKHRYFDSGVFNVSLRVVDDLGINSTNVAVVAVSVFKHPLFVTVFLDPLSVSSFGEVAVRVHVDDNVTGIQDVRVQLLSDHGGNFDPAEGYTDVNGDFNATYFAPRVTEPTEVTILAAVSKEGFSDASGEFYLSVLVASSGTGFENPGVLVFAFIVIFLFVFFVYRRRKS